MTLHCAALRLKDTMGQFFAISSCDLRAGDLMIILYVGFGSSEVKSLGIAML